MSLSVKDLRLPVRAFINDLDNTDYSYEDIEIDKYIIAAIYKMNQKRYPIEYIVLDGSITPTPSEKDKGLIAGIAAIIIDPQMDISWATGELRFSRRRSNTDLTGEQLIDHLIRQAVFAADNDFIITTEGTNNLRGTPEQEDNVK